MSYKREGFFPAATVNGREGGVSTVRFELLLCLVCQSLPHAGLSGTEHTGEWNQGLTFRDTKAYSKKKKKPLAY